ncbi:MAG TPA: TonB-dependent receptor [Bacteroidales bacterium]|nr:TonB-dependent receptor [Bacteroidales bacterium]
MVRKLLTVFVLLLSANIAVFAQSGTLKGKILDKTTKEPVPFANIIAEANGTQAGGSTSDFDGNYTIKPLSPGKYNIKATYVGYKPVLIQGVLIKADQITPFNIEMESTAIEITTYEVVDYKIPLIDKDKTTVGGTVTAEEISKMPSREVGSIVATVGGVFSADGEVGSMRGQRTDGNVTYIDGIKVRGLSTLPQSAIEQVSVVLGGIPAQYGDATGGIINVTTKGPSRTFGGGIELETSEFLDPYGYNRGGVNLTGPLFWNKDKTSSVVGYFLAADFEYKKDQDPLAIGNYKIKDDVLSYLEKNPLRPSGTGFGTYENAEFIRRSDLEHIKTNLNNDGYSINTSGKFDIKTGPNINLTLGGSYNANSGHNFNWVQSLANYNRYSYTDQTTWRLFGRFTQRFPSDKESRSPIKNVYYTIQGDFTRDHTKTYDPDFKDNLFAYGYVGKFTTYKTRSFELDTTTAGFNGYVMNAYNDTRVNFDRAEYNPVLANYTSYYYSLYNTSAGHYDKLDNIYSGGGMLNGDSPSDIYGMYASPGVLQSGYAVADVDQVTLNFSSSADVGNHEIKLGFVFEQSKSSSYSYAPINFWTLMYQLANSHITQLDMSDPTTVYHEGGFDTTYYHRKYNASSQRAFDRNLRRLMGLAVDGTDWIDINSYDIDKQTINYYDADNKMHTMTLNSGLNVNLFSADELLNSGNQVAAARGYDYYGNKLTSKPTIDDFYNATDADGNYTRLIAPFEPIYMAGYIQDKFSFEDLVFNIGLRVDRYDANQSVLKDPYLLYPAKTVGEVTEFGAHPSGMGSDYVVYVDNVTSPTRITGYRDGMNWYDAQGNVVTDPSLDISNGGLVSGGSISPYLTDPDDKSITGKSFTDYEPQITVMPRISFSFPISDEALFYAHYDVLTQRPKSNSTFNPISYLFWETENAPTFSNPNLKPERTVDYELGFQQKLNNTSSLNLSAFYREMRDQIQIYRYTGAYPKTYYSYNNIDFGTVKGLTVTYDLRRTGNTRVRASYTLQFANGTGSNQETSKGLIQSGQPNLRTLIPLNFDRRHAVNLNIDYRYGEGKEYNGPVIKGKKILENAGFNITVGGGSGTPYTRSSKISFLGNQSIISGSINGSRLPWSFKIDGRVDKDFHIGTRKDAKGNVTDLYLNVYLQVLNILNSENIMGVWAATGNPDDDGYLAADEYQAQIYSQLNPESYIDLYRLRANSPYNYSSPRMIRLGLSFNF